jgi:thiol-disulfide isomerase/thioredoxin
MMSAALVLFGVLTLGELLLIMLVARKVHDHDGHLIQVRLSLRSEQRGRSWLEVGTQVPPFLAKTTSDEPVSLERLLGRESVVGFFSPGCRPCRQELPAFARLAASGGRQALAVVVGPASLAEEFLTILDGVVPVVREEQGGSVTTAFATRAFPGVFLLDPDGKVVARGASVGVVTGIFEDVAAAGS